MVIGLNDPKKHVSCVSLNISDSLFGNSQLFYVTLKKKTLLSGHF